MGQELVKFNGATGIVERPDYSVALSGLTPNQERLRELINGEVAPEDSRLYHPPNVESDAVDWSSEIAGQIARIESVDPSADISRTNDPKACWTGFAVGITCAAVIGGAFFLSIAAVVTPQPSIAALVPIETEQQGNEIQEGNQVALRSAVILPPADTKQVDHTPTKITTSTIWHELRRFHASAGKFSQPRILLVSSPRPRQLLDVGQPNERKASLSKPRLEPVALEEQPHARENATSEGPTQLMPRIINAVGEPIVLEKAEASATEVPAIASPTDNTLKTQPKSDRVYVSHIEPINVSEDTMGGATRASISNSVESQPSEPVDSAPITTAGKPIKVVKSSLRPTARTKVRLSEGRRHSIVGSKSRKSASKAAKRAKKKRVAQQYNFFKIQVRPDWAESAFTQSSQ